MLNASKQYFSYYILLSFFRELLHTKQRREETCEHLIAVLGEYSISCEIQLAGPEYESLQAFASLPPAVAEELFGSELPDKEDFSRVLSTEVTQNKASITVDNLLSPAHTLLQIKCADQKGLFYDILRTSKDLNIQVLGFELLLFTILVLTVHGLMAMLLF